MEGCKGVRIKLGQQKGSGRYENEKDIQPSPHTFIPNSADDF